jgi:hypothetical protein
MKQLQWAKIAEGKIKGTMFEKFDLEYKGFKIDYKELEETFSQKVIEKKEKAEEVKVMVQILDPRLSQKISIFLSQFKNQSQEELCEGIKSMNPRMFTLEQVNQLLGSVPTKDDVTSILLYLQNGGDASRLPTPEKFALAVIKNIYFF